MPWCPKCKTEYREGFKICAECGSGLIDTQENTNKVNLKINESAKRETCNGCVETLVANISDSVELTYVTSMLNEAGIAYRIAEAYTGQYLTILHGRSFVGYSLYVSSDLFQDAADIVKSYRAYLPDTPEESDGLPYTKIMTTIGKILILLYMIGSFIFLGII